MLQFQVSELNGAVETARKISDPEHQHLIVTSVHPTNLLNSAHDISQEDLG